MVGWIKRPRQIEKLENSISWKLKQIQEIRKIRFELSTFSIRVVEGFSGHHIVSV